MGATGTMEDTVDTAMMVMVTVMEPATEALMELATEVVMEVVVTAMEATITKDLITICIQSTTLTDLKEKEASLVTIQNSFYLY